MALNIVKKLSTKVLVGNVKSYLKDLQKGQVCDLFRVVGLARGTRSGSSNCGDFTALTGDFVAEAVTGDKAGQRFRTGQLFLPDVALGLIVPIVDNLGKGDSVELAFMVGITPDDDSATGYIYVASFLQEPSANDPMEALLAKAMPALEAPKGPETEKEPAKGK